MNVFRADGRHAGYNIPFIDYKGTKDFSEKQIFLGKTVITVIVMAVIAVIVVV